MVKIKTRKGKIYFDTKGTALDIAVELSTGLNLFIKDPDRVPPEKEAVILADMVATAIKVNRETAFDWDKFLSELERLRREMEVSGNG